MGSVKQKTRPGQRAGRPAAWETQVALIRCAERGELVTGGMCYMKGWVSRNTVTTGGWGATHSTQPGMCRLTALTVTIGDLARPSSGPKHQPQKHRPWHSWASGACPELLQQSASVRWPWHHPYLGPCPNPVLVFVHLGKG